MTKHKGIILPGSGLDYSDLENLYQSGIDSVYVQSDSIEVTQERIKIIKEVGIKNIILDIGWGTYDQTQWKERIEMFDVPYYYMDEPYLVRTKWYMQNRGESEFEALRHTSMDIKLRRDLVKFKRPGSKFVIGDIRALLDKDYKPIDDVWYTYTSYTNNIYIPIIGKAIAIGLGNQSPAIKRLYKNVQGRVPFVWVFGKNKLLCHPDEFHKISKTCDNLNIPMQILYTQDGSEKYKFNSITRADVLEYIEHFIKEEKPYTFWEWWKRLGHRLSLSFGELFRTWNFKEFFDKLF